MKKVKIILSLVLTLVLGVSLLTIGSAEMNYTNPFERGFYGCQEYRIPSLYTLNDGSVMAVADLDWNHGGDSPNNIDVLCGVSADGYTSWQYSLPAYFDDCPDGETTTESASFIDCTVVQSKETDRIFLMTDLWTADGGYPTATKGTGYATFNGKSRLELTDSKKAKWYVTDFDDNGFAAIENKDGKSGYSVDADFYLYKDGAPVKTKQINTGKEINENIFFKTSPFKPARTSFLVVKYSDDNGKTWSSPIMLNSLKNKNEKFFGVGPGRGLAIQIDGHERLLFPVYSNPLSIERSAVVYTDDGGKTWQRSDSIRSEILAGKSSEAQLIELDDGTVRLFARNTSNYITYADSKDGGKTWTKAKMDKGLYGTKNCMNTFITLNGKIDGKQVVVMSSGGNYKSRADGIIRVGLVGANNVISWGDSYHVTDGFYGYSCLSELADGNIGLLYEDEGSHINYMVLTIDAEGKVSEVNGNNPEFTPKAVTFGEKFVNFFFKIYFTLRDMLSGI